MGFLDYAWAISLQKDNLRARIRLDPKLQQPTLTRDDRGFNITLPVPSVSEEGNTSFLGYEFQDEFGKIKAGRLFRAAVFHLTAHTTIGDEIAVMLTPRNSLADIFSEALVNDVYVNTYISASHADSLADIAFANALAFENMKRLERIFNPSTRIMAALLMKVNAGSVKGKISPEEGSILAELISKIDALKGEVATSVAGKENRLGEVFSETVREVAQTLEYNGPILEAPSLPHTEQIGPCTVFKRLEAPSETQVEKAFKKAFEALGKKPLLGDAIELCWKKETNVETLQAFDSWLHQRTREQRILARIQKCTEGTRLKIVEFPEEDYTQYLRARMLLRGGSRRLLDSLRVAQDALDEDPRKEQGQLDLTEVIQKIASNSPRTDVFVENEYLSKSFAWGILFDASASMEVRGEISRALAICVAEATKELLMDPNSWSFYAFNDSFYVLKDASEAYSHRVRARIGGLRFRGLTYMPDAIRVAGKILGQRFDEQRFLIVLSDGWPYGYPDMPAELSAVVASLKKKGIIVIGVGVESERMNEFFKESCSVYDQKDLIKKFSNIFVKASASALET
ncbi:MAG TPA: hypothetical protein VMW14_02935 [Candidatus Paceibacterota bacterium]|nr:hypothetical protein [Candidatus Paceibacterota bacterium]